MARPSNRNKARARQKPPVIDHEPKSQSNVPPAETVAMDSIQPVKSAPAADAANDPKPVNNDPVPQQVSRLEQKRTPVFAAGILGGALALAGFGGLQYSGVLGGGQTNEAQSAAQAVAGVEQSALDALEARLTEQISSVQTPQVTATANVNPGQVKQLVNEAVAEQINALRSENEALRQKLTELRTAISSGESGEAAGLNVLAARLEELEQKSNEQPADGGEAGISEVLDNRISAIEAALNDVGNKVAASVNNNAGEQTKQLDQKISALQGQINRLNGITQNIQQAKPAIDPAMLEQANTKIAELEKTIASIDTKVEETAARDNGARAIAAANLKSAIDRGGAFMGELEVYAKATPDAEEIAALREFAARGVPTQQQLLESFDGTVNDIAASLTKPAEDAGFVDRIWAGAKSRYNIREAGDIGPEMMATLDSMRESLTLGSYELFMQQAKELPEQAQTIAATIVGDVNARHQADRLIDNALTAALGGSGAQAESQ